MGLHFFQRGGVLESIFILFFWPALMAFFPSALPSPCRVLIPQCARVSEPEWDGDGGGLLMWRSAAAIATWGLLSFNQTKPDDECALLGELGVGERGAWRGRKGAGGEVHPEPAPSTFAFLLQGIKKGSLLSQFITQAGETGQVRRTAARARSYRWWVSSGTQKIKHLILN